jgi:hypothetical protein
LRYQRPSNNACRLLLCLLLLPHASDICRLPFSYDNLMPVTTFLDDDMLYDILSERLMAEKRNAKA